jgi:hypothetical protein
MMNTGQQAGGTENTNESDKKIIDVVLKTLYSAANKQALDFEREILLPNEIRLTPDASERIWNILLSSEWVTQEVGFGNAGKLSLTHQGIQLMLQYGGYHQYLESAGKVKPGKTTVHHVGPQNETDIKPLEHIHTSDSPRKQKRGKKII